MNIACMEKLIFGSLPHRPNLATASAVIGHDLSKPIDLSQMMVMDVVTEVVESKHAGGYVNEHTVRLMGHESAGHSTDVIKVTIVRETVRRPDFKAIEAAKGL